MLIRSGVSPTHSPSNNPSNWTDKDIKAIRQNNFQPPTTKISESDNSKSYLAQLKADLDIFGETLSQAYEPEKRVKATKPASDHFWRGRYPNGGDVGVRIPEYISGQLKTVIKSPHLN
jgi:hypothetical protein